MAVQHVYSNAVADGTATSVVRPSDWNSYHNQYMTISGNTAGQSTMSGTNIVFQGGNGVTLSANTAAGAATIVVSGSNQSQQPMYYSASGTNTSANTLQFGNSNGVSFSLTNGSIIATVATNYQSQGNYLTTAMQSNAGSNFAGTNSALTANGVSATYNSSGLSLNFPAFLTTAMQSGASSAFAGTGFTSTTTVGGNIVATHNTAGLSMGIPPYDLAANTTNYQFTSATSAITSNAFPSANTTKFAGTGFTGTNASATFNSNGLQLSVAAGGGGGNTSYYNQIADSASTVTSGTVVFGNANGVSFGLNGSTMTASHNGLTTAMASNAGSNFVAASAAFNGTNITGTIGSNGLSLSVDAPGGGGAAQTLSHWMPFPTANNTVGFAGAQNTIYMQNIIPEANVAVSNIEMMASLGFTSTTNARTNALTVRYGLYEFGTGASSDSIQSIATSSIVFSQSNTANNSGGFTVYNSAGTFGTTSAGTVLFNASQMYGQKYIYFPFTTTLQAGNEYFWAMQTSSATTGGGGGLAIAMFIQTNMTNQTWGELKFSTAATGATNQWEEYDGIAYSVSSSGLFSAADKSQFSMLSNKGRMWMIFENEA